MVVTAIVSPWFTNTQHSHENGLWSHGNRRSIQPVVLEEFRHGLEFAVGLDHFRVTFSSTQVAKLWTPTKDSFSIALIGGKTWPPHRSTGRGEIHPGPVDHCPTCSICKNLSYGKARTASSKGQRTYQMDKLKRDQKIPKRHQNWKANQKSIRVKVVGEKRSTLGQLTFFWLSETFWIDFFTFDFLALTANVAMLIFLDFLLSGNHAL